MPFVVIVTQELWISECIREGLAIEVGIDVIGEDGLKIDGKGRKWPPFYKLTAPAHLSMMKPSPTVKARLQSWARVSGLSSSQYAGFGIVRFRTRP